jgi:hypothetical protein
MDETQDYSAVFRSGLELQQLELEPYFGIDENHQPFLDSTR